MAGGPQRNNKYETMIQKIKIWFWKFQYSESAWMEHLNGKFRVVYSDGNKSIRMYYKNAKSYASIFGGKVIYDPFKN